ncbi:MAG: right-handed parallel beta-helix repeat-containing protein [Anaerolineales bacterium]|nr:right-handed parallel beta-helix repeat-containing protein [Anaerolineales bacterium]
MSVGGSLVARGTAAEPIVFTGLVKQTGSWGWPQCELHCRAACRTHLRPRRRKYAEIVNLWAGGNVDLGYAVADIDNSVFRYGGSNGLAADMGTVLTLRNSSFNGNTLNAVWYEGGVDADPVLSNLSASDNKQFNAVVYSSVSVTKLHRLESMGLPYVLSGGMEVEEGGELAIDPGVELRVDTGFYVRGTMRALGSATQPILITGIKQQPAGWWGLSVSSGTASIANLQLDHVTIEYGGSDSDYGGNLVVSSANVTVTNSILRNSGSHGIYNEGGAPDETFAVKVSNTIISGNQLAAIVCADESCNDMFDNLTVNGNGMDAIVYRSAMGSSGTWRNLGIPYIVEGHAGVANGATLTIEPGVEVRMAKDATFRVDGVLSAVGTPENPILFTGTEKQPGWWRDIRIDGNGVAELRCCDIGYGGEAGAAFDTGQVTTSSSLVSLSNCRIHDSSGAGIMVFSGAKPVLRNNSIVNNKLGLIAVSTLAEVEARFNWWGDASGPKHPNNPNGLGQEIRGAVAFEPWLASPDDTGGGMTGITGRPGRPLGAFLQATQYSTASSITTARATRSTTLYCALACRPTPSYWKRAATAYSTASATTSSGSSATCRRAARAALGARAL